jgi:predicted TIM-barrel fold metal-dependent hydrolase
MSETTADPKPCLPPDPNVTKPKFAVPAGACDSYCHLFGPRSKYAFVETRKYTPPDAPIAKFQALQKALGLERAVFIQPSIHGKDNSCMLDAIAAGGGRYFGVCGIDDKISDADLQKLHDAGIRGVKFNFVRFLGQRPEIGMFRRVAERVAGMGWHLDLHIAVEDVDELEDDIRKLPLPYVIDHMCRVPVDPGVEHPAFKKLLDFLKNDRCWIRISGIDRIAPGGPYEAGLPIARSLIDVVPDRVIWGTDWPHPNVFDPNRMPNDTSLLNFVYDAAAGDMGIITRILVDNPKRLYGFAD